MAEFDFDELDKAVNDLMSNVATDKRNTALDDPQEKVVTIESAIDAAAIAAATSAPVAAAETSPSAPSTPKPPATTAPSLATKRRGQFMDIMHPSQAKPAKPALASRQGVTIQPVKMNAAAQPAGDNTPEVSAMQNTADSDTATSDTPVEQVAAEAPLTTPFLSDAKVEKRPLGANGQITIANTAEEADVDAQIAPTAEVKPPVVLPEELTGDVLAVESNVIAQHAAEPAKEDDPAEHAAEAPAPEALQPAETTPAEPLAAETMLPVADESTETTGPASIPQQYTEQPSTGDQSNGSIYDTATYHQAIEGEAVGKKHTALKWTLIIVGLLILGAVAGGAAFYFTR